MDPTPDIYTIRDGTDIDVGIPNTSLQNLLSSVLGGDLPLGVIQPNGLYQMVTIPEYNIQTQGGPLTFNQGKEA